MTSDRTLPDAARIEAVLAAHTGPWGPSPRALKVEDLSPGLGQSAVLRVHTADAGGSRWIVKIPGGGARSLLDSRDAQLNDREVAFFRSALPARLPAGLATPPQVHVFNVDGLDVDGGEWIVMRDIGTVLTNPWTPEAAVTAAARLALLHAPVAADPTLLDLPWLERAGHHAYAHHVPSCHDNLDATDPRLADLFTPAQVLALHRCLDAAEALAERATRLPSTLVHGDCTPLNAGLDAAEALILIDWEHAGAGPVGFDLATFVSLYGAFGGLGTLDERAMLQAYGRASAEVAGTDLSDAAAAGFAIAHLTWGLHLRLGPGLAAVRLGVHDHSPAHLDASLEDIRTGCLRALSWAETAGVDVRA